MMAGGKVGVRTHGGVNTGDVELVLQRDREAVERSDGLATPHEVLVELPCPRKCRFEEKLGETVGLRNWR